MTALPLALEEDYAELEKAHFNHLLKRGVTLPAKDTQQAVMLVYLYRSVGQLVSLEDLRDFVRSHWCGKSKDLQPRHLKYCGWHILLSGKSGDTLRTDVSYYIPGQGVQERKSGEKLPNGYLMLVTVFDASPDFMVKKRRGAIDRTSWEGIKLSYQNKCAVCKEKKSLEKGHKAPTKELSLNNILPMCSECNNWASSDVVLDDAGRVVALASPRFVEKSELSVKLLILDRLNKDKSMVRATTNKQSKRK